MSNKPSGIVDKDDITLDFNKCLFFIGKVIKNLIANESLSMISENY